MSLVALGWCLPLIANNGYLTDLKNEREERYTEVKLALTPIRETSLKDRIFTQRLTHDLKAKYIETFGFIDSETLDFEPSLFRFQTQNNYPSVQNFDRQQRRRGFAEFTIKKITEFHVENYFKSEPNLRPIYEVKEKLSKAEIQVAKATKATIEYDFAGDSVNLNLENPYFELARLVYKMERDAKNEMQRDTQVFLEKEIGEKRKFRFETRQVRAESLVFFIHEPVRSWTTYYGFGQTATALGDNQPISRIGAQSTF
jgi:hypothetical protein